MKTSIASESLERHLSFSVRCSRAIKNFIVAQPVAILLRKKRVGLPIASYFFECADSRRLNSFLISTNQTSTIHNRTIKNMLYLNGEETKTGIFFLMKIFFSYANIKFNIVKPSVILYYLY